MASRHRSILLASKMKDLIDGGKWHEVLSRYHELRKSGIQITDHTFFPPVLKACLYLSFRHGESVHASLIKQGFFQSFTSIGNSVMDFYAKSGTLDSAVNAFDCISNVDSVSWNIIVHGHLDQGALEQGLCLFAEAKLAGFEPNISTLVLVIQACRKLKAFADGSKYHAYFIRGGFWNVAPLQNSLLCMYADVAMESAQILFGEMCDRDVISWSAMLSGYVQGGEAAVALDMFRQMVAQSGVEADGQIMVIVLKACTNIGEIRLGKLFHGFLFPRGLNHDIYVGNSLVDLYSKCKDDHSAAKAFSEMPCKNDVSWNSLLSGLVHCEKYAEALALFESMCRAGIEADEITLVNLLQLCKYLSDPRQCRLIHSRIIRKGYELNEIVLNSLIDAYAKCDLITIAWRQFSQMKRRDAVTWSTMIAGFTNCGMPGEAIAVFQDMMRVQVMPNAITMLSLLEACSLSAEFKRSKWAHGIAIRRGMDSEVAVGTAILDMYSKCGEIEASRKVFDQLPEKDIRSWSAMIAAYGMNGRPDEALNLLTEMKMHGVKPNPVTILSVLSACSHGGLVECGLSLFQELIQDLGIELKLEHYSCLVDLLARAGELDSAIKLINGLPNGLKPGASAWGSLLSACRNYGNNELATNALSHVLDLEPSSSAGYLLAFNLYASGSSWSDAIRIREVAKEKGVRVTPGYSLFCLDNKSGR